MREKIRQFYDYYLMYVVVVVLILGFVGYFVKTTVFDRKDVVLSVMILNDSQEVDIDQMEADLREELNITDAKQDITFAIMDTAMEANHAVIMTRLRAQSVDILLADKKAFDEYAQGGSYADLDKTLTGAWHDSLQDGFVESREAEYDDSGNITDYGEYLPFGLDLSGSERYKSYGSVLSDPVAGIVVNAEHKELAEEALAFLYKN